MVNIYTAQPGDALSRDEWALYNLIMDYRAANGLPSIPLSKALTTVAGRHALDTVVNIGSFQSGAAGENKAHSWSDAPYDGRNSATYPNMWRAPERLGTGYTGYGYEISIGYTSFSDTPMMVPTVALSGWQGSPGHNDVILSKGAWAQASLQWKAIGIGIQAGVAHVWFGADTDPTGLPTGSAANLPMAQSLTAGNDTRTGFDDPDYLRGLDGNDSLSGRGGNDILEGGAGNDTLNGGADDDLIDGGDGIDMAAFSGTLAQYRLTELGGRILVQGPDGNDVLTGIETLSFSGASVTVAALRAGGQLTPVVFGRTDTTTNAASNPQAQAYSGPVERVAAQFIGANSGEAVAGTPMNDFINALGGDDAVNAGAGDDVLDGGLGSNFLTGGAGWDVFFSDGRSGGITWSTITDWEVGEQLSLWGWRPGVSKMSWSASDGTAGYRGVTLHADLDGNGVTDTSVTWAGRSQASLPTPQQLDGLLWFM